MKLRLFLIAMGLFIVTIIIMPIYFSFKHMADILEFDHPSQNIEHSVKKKIFIDSLLVLNPDTIRTNRTENISILPTSSWIEKRAFWKSQVVDLDSLGFYSDTLDLIVNFENYVDGQRWKPNNNGFNIAEFQNINGDRQSVYMDDNMTQLAFKMTIKELKDSIRLKGTDGQEILLRRVR
jgi:hypothetical protein